MFVFYALAACASFALGSSVFTRFSRQISPWWMNVFKLLIGLFCFLGASLVFRGGDLFVPELRILAFLFFSGLVGLFCGDLLLLTGFQKIGAARAMMIFAFQPLFVGGWSYFLFNQVLSVQQGLAVFFLMLCMLTMSYEQFRLGGAWKFGGLLCAVLGVLLDGVGVVATRLAFEGSAGLGVFEANFYRSLGAFAGFAVFWMMGKRGVRRGFQRLNEQEKILVVLGSVLGVFVSLTFWLKAISLGSLATVSAIGGSAPLFASIFEHFFEKKQPTRYFYGAFLFFAIGFSLMIL